jgi:hypothetical protein
MPFPLNEFGYPALTVLRFPDDSEYFQQSWLIDVPTESTAIKDIWIGNDFAGALNENWISAGLYELWSTVDRGSYIEFVPVDRDDISGAFGPYGLDRSKLTNLTSVSGTFQVGETVVGGTSGARTTVLAVNTNELEVRFWVCDANDEDDAFSDGETITGQTSGATATLDTPAFDEGDVLYLRKPYLKDEMIRNSGTEQPPPVAVDPGGGSKMVPAGYYYRFIVYSANTSGTMTVKVSTKSASR